MIRVNKYNNIVLIGMSGVGKTSIGKYMGSAMNRHFLDTDDIIVTTSGKTISYIFNEYGEKYFRELEKQTIKSLLNCYNKIIATGGGVVLENDNMDMLKKNGIIFFLDGSINTLVNNLKSTLLNDKHRPLLANNNDLSYNLKEMYYKRRNLYISNSDYIIKVDDKPIDIIGEEIIQIYKEISPCSYF